MRFWSAFHRASLSPESPHSIVLRWAVTHIPGGKKSLSNIDYQELAPESLSLGGPGSTVAKLPDDSAIVAVVDCSNVSHLRVFD